MPNKRSRVTAEQVMPGSRTESSRNRQRPQRDKAIEEKKSINHTTIVQQVGIQSHNHDDRYPLKDGGADLKLNLLTVNGRAIFVRDTICQHIGATSLFVSGTKNAVIRRDDGPDLFYAATESDRARFWTYVEAADDDPAAVLAQLPDEFTSVTQAPYWISFETGYQLDGTETGRYARVTADVRDDLGPQQAPYGRGR